MNRRCFTRRALTFVAVSPVSVPLVLAQEQQPDVDYDYVELANAFTQSILGVSRQTDVAEDSQQLADLLLQATGNAIADQFGRANELVEEFGRLLTRTRNSILSAAETKGLTDLFPFLDTAADRFPSELQRWEQPEARLYLPFNGNESAASCNVRSVSWPVQVRY